jgi:IS66 Orf2 like protein
VAIEAIDGRKGIDSLAQLCREKLDADPFSGALFIFRSRSAKAIRILAYDGQGFWLATKRLSKGRFRWWPTGQENSESAACTSGSDAAGSRQSGSGSRAGVAARERIGKSTRGPCVPVFVLPD